MLHSVDRAPTAAQVIESCCASFWLKKAVASSLDRDILDALRDAETLVSVLQKVAVSAGLRV